MLRKDLKHSRCVLYQTSSGGISLISVDWFKSSLLTSQSSRQIRYSASQIPAFTPKKEKPFLSCPQWSASSSSPARFALKLLFVHTGLRKETWETLSAFQTTELACSVSRCQSRRASSNSASLPFAGPLLSLLNQTRSPPVSLGLSNPAIRLKVTPNLAGTRPLIFLQEEGFFQEKPFFFSLRSGKCGGEQPSN